MKAEAVVRGATANPSIDVLLPGPLPSAIMAAPYEVVRSFCLSTVVLVFSWPVARHLSRVADEVVLRLSTGGGEEMSVGGRVKYECGSCQADPKRTMCNGISCANHVCNCFAGPVIIFLDLCLNITTILALSSFSRSRPWLQTIRIDQLTDSQGMRKLLTGLSSECRRIATCCNIDPLDIIFTSS